MVGSPRQDALDFGNLLREARAGSREALGRALMDCRDYLLLVANQKMEADLQGKVSPSDVVQDTFLEAQQDFGQFHGERKDELLAWLGRILVNNLANASRRFRATDMRDLSREVPLAVPDSDSRPGPQVAMDTPTPSNRAIANEELAALERALEKLPPRSQEVIRLRYDQQLGFAEIGQSLSCSAEAARKLWARAVDQLQRELNAREES